MHFTDDEFVKDKINQYKEKLRKQGCTQEEFNVIIKDKDKLLTYGPEKCLKLVRNYGNLEYTEQLENDDLEKALNDTKAQNLSSTDYAVLDIINRGDIAKFSTFGIMQTAESMFKLYANDMIERSSRQPTADELERIQVLIKSPAYVDSLEKFDDIINPHIKKRLNMITKIISNNSNDLIDITNYGRKKLKLERARIINLYIEIKDHFEKHERNFYHSIDKYQPDMPMLLIMGFGGEMIRYLSSSSNAKYLPIFYLNENVNYANKINIQPKSTSNALTNIACMFTMGILTGGMIGLNYDCQ